jgi:hypothetical protein
MLNTDENVAANANTSGYHTSKSDQASGPHITSIVIIARKLQIHVPPKKIESKYI